MPLPARAIHRVERALAQTRKDGVLPRSILIAGKVYPFKEFLKDQFEDIRYKDLVLNGGEDTKAAWLLPVDAQTPSTGTLADFLISLGATVTVEELDEDDDKDDDAKRDDQALVDEEAEEGDEDEEEEEEP